MAATKRESLLGNKRAVGNKGGHGCPTKFSPEKVKQAEMACRLGFTDFEISQLFGVSESTIHEWKLAHTDFALALKGAKPEADERVKQSLYHRALGYKHDAVKIMTVDGKVKKVPYTEVFPPDTTAAIFWLKNRQPRDWRDRIEHTGADGEPVQFVMMGRLVKEVPAPAIEHRPQVTLPKRVKVRRK